jgi:sodium/hydrogen exchanger 8
MVDLMQSMRNENVKANATQPAAGRGIKKAVPGVDDDLVAPALPGEGLKYEDIENSEGEEKGEPIGKTHSMAKFFVVPVSIVFFVVYNIATFMEKFEITAIPESAVVIAIGVVLGFFMKKYTHLDTFEDVEAWGELNSTMLNLMFLPIIIFASGWALRRQDFFSQFPYILMFAVVGTGVSTCVVAGLINLTGRLAFHNVTRWRTAFAFASLISATDPVATLSTYSKLKVDPLLGIMVFGESTINDAVAIVLFRVFNANADMQDPVTGEDLYIGPQLVGKILFGIIRGFFGSLIVGVGLGMLYTLIARLADMRENKKGQILVIFVSCYLTYALAESIGLSGIIAEIFCSLVMGIYMRPHLSAEGCVLTTFFVKQLSTLADSAVFLLVGVSVVQLTTNGWKIGIWTIFFCLVARFFSTYPIAYAVNGLKQARGVASGIEREGWNLLTQEHMFMMWHAGLRGGIALALAWELGPWVDAEGAGTRHALQTATFLVIIFFLAFFGGSTSFSLKYLGIPIGTDAPEDVLSKTEPLASGASQGIMKKLDEVVLTPLLIGNASGDDKGAAIPDDVDAEELIRKAMHLHKW